MIRLENVVKKYDNGLINALNGVSCRIGKGEVVALKGPSGSGKSTLLSIIGTIDEPTQGSVWLDGRPIQALKPYHRLRALHIGMIFQLHHLLPHLTALENVEIPMYAVSRSKNGRRQKARHLLEAVGLSHKVHCLPGHLSGGERQRVAVARACANSPAIILADEPTGSLDTRSGGLVLDLLMTHCRANRTTVVLATHDNDVAERADRCIRLKDGQIIP